jgi:predicted CoA-binding protein
MTSAFQGRRADGTLEVFPLPAEVRRSPREAIEAGPKALWLQLGIEIQTAKRVAEAAGLTLAMNRRMGEADFGPGPDSVRGWLPTT